MTAKLSFRTSHWLHAYHPGPELHPEHPVCHRTPQKQTPPVFGLPRHCVTRYIQYIKTMTRQNVNIPFKARMASSASLRSSNSIKAKPGGLRPTNTLKSMGQTESDFQQRTFKLHKGYSFLQMSYITSTHLYILL
jgi:hypothetical protein